MLFFWLFYLIFFLFQVKSCEFPQFKYGCLYYEEILRPNFPVSIGNKYSYKCDNGFSPPSGLFWDYLRCTVQGWEPEVPCVRKCVFHYVENGESAYWEKIYVQGQSLKVQCYNGYSLQNGQDTMTCTENGWSPPPKCIRIKIECSVPILDRKLVVSPRKEKYRVGDLLEFSCRSGHRVGPDSVQCYHFGWSPSFPTCKGQVASCAQPPEIPNGEINGAKRVEYSHGEVVGYDCKPRFLLKGPNKIQCVDGMWTTLPVCVEEERTCGDIPELEHGSVKFSVPPYHHGDSVEFTCAETFTMIGLGSVSCLSGKWTQLPKCVATDQLEKCRVLKSTDIEAIKPKRNEFQHNSTMYYKCRDKQEYEHSICINGKWNPEPNCTSKWKTSCPPPPQIPNTLVIETTVKYLDGEKLSVLCQDNYLTQDPEEMMCKDGRWQSLPHCIDSRGKCGPPPPIDNGDITSLSLPEYEPFSSVDYQCQKYYLLKGKKTITCRNGKWSEPPTCLHACIIPENIMEARKIILKRRHTENIYSHSGEDIEFECKYGYHKARGSPPFRTKCISGTINYPTCE
uniref:Sushi domain-containing protein n=1 Tax=Mus spicilegus TaxID=10103 RepID=A0A8C6N4N3_MUSSI